VGCEDARRIAGALVCHAGFCSRAARSATQKHANREHYDDRSGSVQRGAWAIIVGMERTIYAIDDPVSRDELAVLLAGERLLVRSTVDGRARVVVVCHGRAEGLRLAHALLDALGEEAA